MKNKTHSTTALLLIFAVLSSVVFGEPKGKGRIWEKFAVHVYSNLRFRGVIDLLADDQDGDGD